MKLSVIIPVYKVENTLQRCVNSITIQDYNDMEIILVDDGSPDKCGEMCDNIALTDKRICVIHKENGGLSDARNAGIEKSTGEYITFVDSDDTIAEGTYSSVMSIIEKHPEYDIVEFPVFVFYGSPQQHIIQFKDEAYTDLGKYWYEDKAYMHSYAWNKIYKRKIFNNIRFPKGKLFEDMHTLPSLLENTNVTATTGKGMYYYYANNNGIVSTIGGERLDMLLDAHIKAMKKFHNYDMTYLMHVVNIQLDVFRIGGEILLEHRKTNIKDFKDLPKTDYLKALILHIFGIRTLCRVHKIMKSLL